MTKPKIVCLCGSTRFYEKFQEANYRRTMAGEIVLSVGFYRPSPQSVSERVRYEGSNGETWGCTPAQKEALDELHFRKIDLADEVYVLNVDGYIGGSTAREIAYAIFTGKKLSYLEPVKGEEMMVRRSHEIGKMVAAFMEGRTPSNAEWPGA